MWSWTLVVAAACLLPAMRPLAASSSSSSGSTGSTSVSATLNTLTTSCNGGCSVDSACVVVGQLSANKIDCVNDTSCVTLSSGQSALCMDAFASSATEWVFQPAETNDTAGAAPFERVGLLQLDAQVTDLTFKRATEPLSGALELSSMNVQPEETLDKVTFQNLSLSGMTSALALNSVKRIYINSCLLSSIPTQVLSGDSVTIIDLSSNAITEVATDFQDASFVNLTLLDLSENALTTFDLVADNFPALQTLYLRDNALESVPEIIFNLSSLQYLTLATNPINASTLTADQFTFLAGLRMFTIDGLTNTSACPTAAVQSVLNDSFTFCVGADDVVEPSSTTTIATETPPTTAPATTESTPSSSSSHKTWIIVGACLGAVVLLLLLLLIWYCCRRRHNELPKLMNSSTPSIAIGMGDMSDHPYMELGVPRSNASSQTTSDFELLASVADGYIGLTRLSYDDVFLHKMLRVSSRSELWLGEFKHEAVLVKKIKSNTASKALLRDFVTEIELMFELKHPRIAAFRGAMWDADGTELCAVVEYVERGALRDCTVNTAIELSVPKQHAIARQISEAMAFLHKQNIVHGRLNAFNILLDRDYSAKLSLFSIFHYVKLSPLDGECRIFAAPEVLRGEQPTERSDVYAFGVVLVEIDTGETPVVNARRLSMERSGRDSIQSPTAKKTGFRLSRLCSGAMKETIAACLDKDPMRRPSMADVAFALKTGAMTL